MMYCCALKIKRSFIDFVILCMKLGDISIEIGVCTHSVYYSMINKEKVYKGLFIKHIFEKKKCFSIQSFENFLDFTEVYIFS